MYVRGNPEYGKNDHHENGDDTVTDRATGLTWMQVDSGHLKAGKKSDWQAQLVRDAQMGRRTQLRRPCRLATAQREGVTVHRRLLPLAGHHQLRRHQPDFQG
jgi:hypothetical protein